jgi:uncharacterized protein YbcC (UPF0753/DUF2309 family)
MHTLDSNPLRRAVDHAAHLLPVQGPIGVFIHHNTLHSFQHKRFEEAVVEAGQIFEAEPFMTETAFRRDFAAGRIKAMDLDWVLDREPNADVIPGRLDRRTLRRAMLNPEMLAVDALSVPYLVKETGHVSATEKARTIWSACLDRLEAPPSKPRPAARPVAVDEFVHPLLIRLCAVYTDQGMSYWTMPGRENGFYGAVRDLMAKPAAFYPSHLRGLDREFVRQRAAGLTAEAVVRQAMQKMGVAECEWQAFLESEMLALPGWAGLMRLLERDPGLAPHVKLPCSLMDFLAVRFTFTVVVLDNTAGSTTAWRKAVAESIDGTAARQLEALRMFEAARMAGIKGRELKALDQAGFAQWRAEVAAFHEVERRRIWHLAYERRHELLMLGPLGNYRQSHPPQPRTVRPAAQVFFCIDEREESMRRALEECDPELETLSAVGFFGVAVDYQGIDDAHGVSLCPVMVKPQHAVRERARQGHEDAHETRVSRRKRWAAMVHGYSVGSKTLVLGWASTAFLGFLSMVPLIARVLSPRRFARLRARLNELFFPEPRTELAFMRGDLRGLDAAEGLAMGFNPEEKAARVAGVLCGAGLTRVFSDIVVVLGHGSTSLNNPHESAYDCGACGGRRGGPNGRLFAAMANRPAVRQALRAQGIDIPDSTWFVGGYHDTCSDDIDLYDTDLIPAANRLAFDRVKRSLDQARTLNARERCRRFEAASGTHTAKDSLLHVQERSEHLAEPRPEYGHCTNAVAFVGRRVVTRGLFLDRRAFLISYDSSVDPEDKFIANVLGAAMPVCAGINLEYYFSFVDNERYGCGTKLPHNVTGLVGVMNGHAGDLRTGLHWQTVEIHEPVRVLFVIETTPERLMKVIGRNPELVEFVENSWVRIATMDPDTGALQVYRGGGRFEAASPADPVLPRAKTSVDFYRGKLEHLPLAEIAGTA